MVAVLGLHEGSPRLFCPPALAPGGHDIISMLLTYTVVKNNLKVTHDSCCSYVFNCRSAITRDTLKKWFLHLVHKGIKKRYSSGWISLPL